MAHRAINRVLLSFVILRSVILNQMTSDAFRWGVQYRSFVAGRALSNTSMSAGELKASRGVIERRWLPSGRGMAGLALNRDACSRVIWILGSGEVRGVASVTVSRSTGEACGVALGTGCGSMNTRQREVRG